MHGAPNERIFVYAILLGMSLDIAGAITIGAAVWHYSKAHLEHLKTADHAQQELDALIDSLEVSKTYTGIGLALIASGFILIFVVESYKSTLL